MNEEKVLDYYVVVKGLYGRNRTTKIHSVALDRRPVDQPADLADVQAKAEEALREIKFKRGYVRIEERPLTLQHYPAENGSPAYTLQVYALFSGRTMYEANRA